jgi:hypothetical protein
VLVFSVSPFSCFHRFIRTYWSGRSIFPVLPVSSVFAGVSGVLGGLLCGGPCRTLVWGARSAGVAGATGVTGFCGAWPVPQKAGLGSEGDCAPHAVVAYLKGNWLQGRKRKAGLEVWFYIVEYITVVLRCLRLYFNHRRCHFFFLGRCDFRHRCIPSRSIRRELTRIIC